MPNLRVIYDNAADRATALTASTSVGALVPANLKNDMKSVVWRSASAAAGVTPSATLDLSWTTAEMVAGVALAYCNLTSQALVRVRGTNEAPATNLVPGSESLSTAYGWSGASVAATTKFYAGVVPYQEVAKALSSTNENRGASLGTVAAGAYVTLTVALRAGTVSAAGVGLYDSTAASWGANADSSALVLAGPGALSRSSGGLFNVSGLTATDDTLVQITRLYQTSGTGYVLLYPGTAGSSTAGQSVLATRVQAEAGLVPTSYYPTTSAAATRPLGYMDSWQSYALNTGWVSACAAPPLGLWNWGAAPLGANAYAYGGGATGRAWVPAPAAVRALRIEITDAGNPGGYIEASRLVCGAYWEPQRNADYGASLQVVDASKNYRNDAGDLMSDAGTVSSKLQLSMSKLQLADATTLYGLLRGNGIIRPVFVSLFPEDANPAREQAHQLYGKLVSTPAMTLPFFNVAAATLEIESV
jgi:hypothetical protein